MRNRRRTVRMVGFGLAGVMAAALLLGAVTWVTRSAGPLERVASNQGGFSLDVPRRWHVEHRRPTSEHADFLIGGEKALLPFMQRGGFWVSRFAVGPDATNETIQARMRGDQEESPRDNWTVRDTRLAGRAAVVVTFTEEPPEFAGRLRLGQRRVVMYELLARGFRYQVGLWTLPHAGSVTAILDRIASSLRLFSPRPWTLEVGETDARLTLPAGWTTASSDLRGVVLHAFSPGDPSKAWMYVFHYNDPPAESLRGALRNIPANGGTIVGHRKATLDGRSATRLDFTFPDEGHAPARDTEWFVSDGDGGSFVLAVGVRFGDPGVADRIASTWRF